MPAPRPPRAAHPVGGGRPVLAGGAGALLAVTGSVGLVWVSYRVDEFREPRYTGALERAPAVVDAVKREFGDLDGMRGRLRVLAGQINELSQVAVGTGPRPTRARCASSTSATST